MAVLLFVAVGWAFHLCRLDFRDRTLPNVVTVGGLVFFLVWHVAVFGLSGLTQSFAGAAISFLFLIVPWLYGAVGGGDVKMMAASGAAVGFDGVLLMIMVTSVAGLVLAVGFILAGAVSTVRLRHLVRCAVDVRYDRRAGAASLPAKTDERLRIPFSLPISLGMLSVLIGLQAGP